MDRVGGDVANVTNHLIDRHSHYLSAKRIEVRFLVTCLCEQALEVRNADFVEVAHVGDGRLDVSAAALVSTGMQFLRRRTDQSLHAADVPTSRA